MINSDSIKMNLHPEFMNDPASNIFDCTQYIGGLRTFYAYFGVIPSYKTIRLLDAPKVIKWVEETFSESIVNKHSHETYRFSINKVEAQTVIFLIEDKILIEIAESGFTSVLHTTENEAKAQDIFSKLIKFRKVPKKEAFINIITNSFEGLQLSKVKCPKPKMQLAKNYNDDLVTLHKDILKSLNQNDKSGLFLFHGKPGTGKSTYIRYLISNVKKKFIFLSPKLADNLDTPNFINLLIENRNSVLVIEDAEDLLASRDKSSNSAISILLNLTDGLLGESLGIQTICTFNAGVHDIDEALMRKGRLMAMYEFKSLAAVKANLLLTEMGTGMTTNQPMTLSDLYNTNKKGFSLTPNKNHIGFKVA